MFIEIHVLQNFAPSNLNRDDTGAPKDCTFGGYRRARISSQCLKRALRKHLGASHLFEPSQLATRTKRIVDELVRRVVKLGKPQSEAETVAVALLGAANIAVKEGKTEYLLYVGDDEIEKLAGLCVKHWGVLAAAGKPAEGADEAKAGKKKSGKDAKKDARDAIPEAIQKEVLEVIGSGKAVDLALFGRMLADMPEKNVDAACQVANALSVNEVAMEMDFYTAVDDLKPDDTQGADMMGVVEFNSSCFYRYAKVDMGLLKENLKLDGKLAARAAAAVVSSAIAAVPTGKQNSMAAHNPPGYVRVLVREGGEAWNVANAFEKPVRPRKNDEGGLTQLAAVALDGYLGALRRMYGAETVKVDLVSALFDEKSLPVTQLVAAVEKALA
jgi:CRISPR system Cascade subunit CasC